MPYSEVTQPCSVSRRKGGTFSSTLAVQMTCVWPTLMSADPSAYMLTPVWISTGRMSRSVLPSRRCMLSPTGSTLEVDLLEPPDRPAQEPRPDLAEPLRRVGHEEMIPLSGRRLFRQEAPLLEALAHGRGGGPGRVDQRDARADRLVDDPFQKRIVGAPENQRVDPVALEVSEVERGRRPGHLIIHPTLLGQRHEQRPGAAADPGLRQAIGNGAGVGPALDGGGGADDADHLPARAATGGAGPGLGGAA